MKMTFEGTEEECVRAAMLVARGHVAMEMDASHDRPVQPRATDGLGCDVPMPMGYYEMGQCR